MIDSYAEEYMLLDNDEKRVELSELIKEEEHAASIYWIVFVITICLAGFCGWLLFIGNGQMYTVPFVTQGFIAALIFFPIFMFIEVAWVRSSVRTLPMFVMLLTSAAATVLSKFVLIYLAVYSVYFIFKECRVIGMKILPGYPDFAHVQDSGLSKRMTYEQMIAYDRKQRELQNPLISDGEELEKLLRGELDLDGYLGVVSHSKAEEMSELKIPDDLNAEGSVTDNAGEDS